MWLDASKAKFEGGDGESNRAYEICWHDHGKRILAGYPVLADIRLCAAAVGEGVAILTSLGLARNIIIPLSTWIFLIIYKYINL